MEYKQIGEEELYNFLVEARKYILDLDRVKELTENNVVLCDLLNVSIKDYNKAMNMEKEPNVMRHQDRGYGYEIVPKYLRYYNSIKILLDNKILVTERIGKINTALRD